MAKKTTPKPVNKALVDEYMAAGVHINETKAGMVDSVVNDWARKFTDAGPKVRITVLVVVKQGLLTPPPAGKGFGEWVTALGPYKLSMIKERKMEDGIDDLDKAMQKMKQRLFKALEEFPLMIKAKEGRTNMATQVAATRALMVAKANQYGHEAALKHKSGYAEAFKQTGKKYVVVKDGKEWTKHSAAPTNDMEAPSLVGAAKHLLDAVKTSAEFNPHEEYLYAALEKFVNFDVESVGTDGSLETYYGAEGVLTIDSVDSDVNGKYNLDLQAMTLTKIEEVEEATVEEAPVEDTAADQTVVPVAAAAPTAVAGPSNATGADNSSDESMEDEGVEIE